MTMAMRVKFLLGALLTVLLLSSTRAEEAGREVVVVYNSKVPASKSVAEYYARKRDVPAENIISLDLPETETITRDDYEKRLEQPLWKELRARKLLTYGDALISTGPTQQCNVVDAKVRYAVLCYGVPLKIVPDPGRKEEIAEKLQPELRRNEAAVDSELALLPFRDRALPLVGFLPNPLYFATNRALMNPKNGVMMVTRLDGPTPEIAKGLVDKATQAERDGLWGRAYFDMRGLTNGPYKIGDDLIRGAEGAARVYGFEITEDNEDSTFGPSTPLGEAALYFGWYDQSVSGPFTNNMVEFRPGAIAYHLHSFSSRALRVTDTWWTGPLLAAGATATMGCTEEPYLQTTPQVNVFLSRMLYMGFSFGEAAYACQGQLSWQNTIIGDPLYRPFAKTQQERYNELEAAKDKNIEWSMLMWINFRLNQNAPLDEIEKFYEVNPVSKTSSVLQEKLGDIYKSKGKLFNATDAYRTALGLPLTRLQRLRLVLKAGPILATFGHEQEVYDQYQALLKDYPNYLEKKDLYERLADVAGRLHKNEEAERYQRLAKEAS